MNSLVVYFDYTCSYSYTVARWLRQIETLTTEIATEWRPFVLEEANRAPEQTTPIWERTAANNSLSAAAFVAGQAAAKQAPDVYEHFRFLLQAAIHDDHLDPRQPTVLAKLATKAGLDLDRFDHDRRQPELLQEVGGAHRQAVRRHGVFGTPTLAFPHGQAFYLKLRNIPSSDEGPWLLELLRELAEHQTSVEEFKLARRGRLG